MNLQEFEVVCDKVQSMDKQTRKLAEDYLKNCEKLANLPALRTLLSVSKSPLTHFHASVCLRGILTKNLHLLSIDERFAWVEDLLSFCILAPT
jgi:hypothetical protein